MKNAYGFDPPEDELTHIQEHLRYLAFPVDKLNQDPNNAREHPDKNYKEVKKSIEEYQVREALKVRKKNLVIEAGNLRHRVLSEEEYKWAPILLCDDDEETATKFALVDNRTAELGVWRDDVVAEQLDKAEKEWGSIEATGFTDEDKEMVEKSIEDELDFGSGLEEDYGGDDTDLTDDDQKMGKITVKCPPGEKGSVKEQIELILEGFPEAYIS